jgi:hypothetical protein
MAHPAMGVRRKIRKLGYRARERLYTDVRPSADYPDIALGIYPYVNSH